MNLRLLLATTTLVTLIFAGCHEPTDDHDHGADTITIAFTIKDDYENPDLDPTRLAGFMEDQTGFHVELHNIASDGAAIEALRFGRADLAFLDGGAAWIAWQQYDLQAIAADQNSDGRTYYEAQAWVLADSNITTFDQLQSKNSCHTGWLKSAGMLMPMGYLIGNDIAPVVGDANEIESLRTTVDAFFGEALIPEGDGNPYLGYEGAFRCLSDGTGHVAFVKDTTYDDYCAGDTAREFCLERDAYTTLPAFGRVPSHPVMVSNEMSHATQQKLLDALLALNDSTEGQSILEDVLNTPGITAVDTVTHLGSYSDIVEHVPGLANYFGDKHDIA